MRKTTNYELTLYDKEDKMSITAERDSLNANMEIIDEALNDKASIDDVTTYIEEHKDELKGADGKDYVLTEADKEEIVDIIDNKGYLTSIPSDYKTKIENDDLYQPKGNYLTEADRENIISEASTATGYITYTNLFDKTKIKTGFFYTGSTTGSGSSYAVTSPMWLEPGDYLFTAFTDVFGANTKSAYIVNSDGTPTGKLVVGTELSSTIYHVRISTANYYGFNVAKVGTSKIDEYMIVKGVTLDDYPPTYVPYDAPLKVENKKLEYANNPLYQKKVVFDGDSICNGGSAATGSGWASRIGEANRMVWHNEGIGGGTITSGTTTNSGSNRHWISTNLDTIYSQHPDLDYLILEGGTNDADLLGEERLGTISTTKVLPTDFDPTADFTQAMEYLLSKAIYLYPNANIGFIVAHKMGTYNNYETSIRRKYFDRCVEVCKKYGIPCLDLWNTSHLHPKIDKASHDNAYYMYADGQHLSDAGYDYISPIIEGWMQTLGAQAVQGTYVLTDSDKEDISALIEVNIPTKTSQLTNDSGYLTSVPTEYKTKTENDALYQPKGNYLTENDKTTIIEEVLEIINDDGTAKVIEYETTAGGYYGTNGEFHSSSSHTAQRTNLIPVIAGDRFIYTGNAPYDGNVSVIWLSDETTKLSHERKDAVEGSVLFTAPSGAKFARFYNYYSNGMLDREMVFGFSVIYWAPDTEIEIEINTKLGGYFSYNNGGTYIWQEANTDSKYTNSIPVNPGDQFEYTGNAQYDTCGVVWSDKDGQKISNEQYTNNGYPATVTVTAPAGAAFVRFFSFSYGAPTLLVTKITKEAEEEAVLNSNVLYGKKYVACGDSFTEGAYSSKTEENWSEKFQCYKTYPFWIADRNQMILVNEAKSGSDFTNIEGAVNAFSVDRYKAVPTDADYITLMFGLNETGMGADTSLIGTKDDATNATLWGAYNIVFEHLITNMPYAKIGVIIADAWMPQNYANAVKEICKYWGIPCLDLKGDDRVPMLIGGRYDEVNSKAKELRNAAFQVSAEDSHPNVKAHAYRSTIIENFMRSL